LYPHSATVLSVGAPKYCSDLELPTFRSYTALCNH